MMNKTQSEYAWDLAMTIANNICIQVSDDFNNDDDIKEAHAASECAKRIRGMIGETSYIQDQVEKDKNCELISINRGKFRVSRFVTVDFQTRIRKRRVHGRRSANRGS